ncbi:hypothetical protein JAAARDRAFT_198421 [Jaapia argillacea MUCL 33604]|uniref:Uncharacterized protein n=1 Tax=Jaapia argillacea MUCL 33604 TaxID=933084 RepID=A0A067PPJ4_9AGAM|nr:hypothetical protein JAAARDRAFT_198421 [Jaapia argillacea MUCL 33604]
MLMEASLVEKELFGVVNGEEEEEPTMELNSKTMKVFKMKQGLAYSCIMLSIEPAQLPHCSAWLGAKTALNFEEKLTTLSYSPDVHQMFDKKQFENLGFTPVVKRKHADLVAGMSELDIKCPKARGFRYEVEFSDGGWHTYYGPGMCPVGMVASPATSEEQQMMEEDGISWGDWNVVG